MESMSRMKSEFGDDIDDDVMEITSQKRKNGTDIDLKCTGSTYSSKRFKNESSEPDCIEHRKVVSKPPLPPKTDKTSTKLRKRDDNSSQLQRLTTQCNQLRLEIVELKDLLANEKSAVRALKAQNDAENRKSKLLLKKKCEEELQAIKKNSVSTKSKTTDNVTVMAPDCHAVEILKLTKEILILQKKIRNLEEKLQISSKAERQISSDLRELKDSYELRLTQISKSAKLKIHRLLEEIKVKDKQNGQPKTATKTMSIKSKKGITDSDKRLRTMPSKNDDLEKEVMIHGDDTQTPDDDEKIKNLIVKILDSKNLSNNDADIAAQSHKTHFQDKVIACLEGLSNKPTETGHIKHLHASSDKSYIREVRGSANIDEVEARIKKIVDEKTAMIQSDYNEKLQLMKKSNRYLCPRYGQCPCCHYWSNGKYPLNVSNGAPRGRGRFLGDQHDCFDNRRFYGDGRGRGQYGYSQGRGGSYQY